MGACFYFVNLLFNKTVIMVIGVKADKVRIIRE